jgi:hypothetical protein
MAKIENRSPFVLVVAAREYTEIVDPGETIQIPNDVAEAWVCKEPIYAMISQGLIVASTDTPRKQTAAPEVEPETPTETKATKRPHWRTVIKRVNNSLDLDELSALYHEHTAPKILTAIEARIVQLQAEAGEV